MTLKHTLSTVLLIASLLISMKSYAESAEVISADVVTANQQTSIALLINQRVKYTFFSLENPSRFVLDIENLVLNDALKALKDQITPESTLFKGLRVAKFNATTVRLVVDLQPGAKANVSDLSAKLERQQRLVLDISSDMQKSLSAKEMQSKENQTKENQTKENQTKENQTKENQTKDIITKSSQDKVKSDKSIEASPEKPQQDHFKVTANETSKPVGETLDVRPVIDALPVELPKNETYSAQQTSVDTPTQDQKSQVIRVNKRDITIAVDAGHGGEDPGARGANGSHEKDITLTIAKKLKQKIDEQEGMRAILIRDGDYFVPLGERVKKARAAKADLFISIHADAFVNSAARGSSVFALSQRGATSASARYLAQKENAVDLIGGVSLDTKDIDLAKTLLDLSQTATIHDGIRLGKSVLKKIGAINKLHTKHVEQAAFAVLKSPDIPSILVETAFISNPEEEAKLNDDDYQDKLAQAILSGIKSYIATNPAFARK